MVAIYWTRARSFRSTPRDRVGGSLKNPALWRGCVFNIALRHLPPPCIVEEHNNACFIVRDAAGQALGYF